MNFTEQRRFERVYFSTEEGWRVTLTPPEMAAPRFTATLMDLSEGGCCLIKERGPDTVLRNGAHLQVREWNGSSEMGDLAGTRITVRWLLELEGAKHIMFGTEFDDMDAGRKERLQRFIADRMAMEAN